MKVAGVKTKSYSDVTFGEYDTEESAGRRQVQLVKGHNNPWTPVKTYSKATMPGQGQQSKEALSEAYHETDKWRIKGQIIIGGWDELDIKPDKGFRSASKVRMATMQATYGNQRNLHPTQAADFYDLPCQEVERLLRQGKEDGNYSPYQHHVEHAKAYYKGAGYEIRKAMQLA